MTPNEHHPGTPGEAPLHEASRTDQPSSSRRQVLFVEDNPELQELIHYLLAETYEVTPARSAGQALDYARQRAFDLILLDINLGQGPSGETLVGQLRALPSYVHTPIVAVTAYARDDDRDRFRKLGFTTYLRKPFEMDDLLNLTSRLLPPA